MGKKSKKSKEELIAKRLAKAQAGAFVQRPFEGLPFEADLVCLRELVPAATAITVKRACPLRRNRGCLR